VARLIKSEKEVEGRYEEVWTLVEEDALDQWPPGPGDVVGRPAVRLDGYEKARGIARYTGDLQLPGTLHAALLRSPFARCRVRRIDLAVAAAAPGVLAVIGPGELESLDSESNFEGSAVGAVAAETMAQAEAAVRLIDVEWEELEPLLDADEAVRRGSLIADTRRYDRGDYDAGISAADAVVEAEYRTQTLNHNSMETHQCVCEWRGDSLDVHVSTQYIWGVRNDLAAQLGLAPDKVRVICEFMGGGFGSKAGVDNYMLIAAELSKHTGRPVRCSVTRRDENVVSGNRNATLQRVTAAARADGTLTALGGEYTCALGWDGWLVPTAGPVQLLYACDNVRTVEHGAKLNLPPMAAFRAPGFVEGTWSLECVLDKLAAELGIDPLELR
jgi:xanthine dehydrogenase YagR molybdenum-binding subunit